MLKKIINFLIIIFIFQFFFLSSTQAQIIDDKIKMTEQKDAFQKGVGIIAPDSIGQIAEKVIKAFLSLLAVIFIILIIVAGYSWMTAQGDEGKVTTAKDSIKRAIIGLIIIIAAYSITAFVFRHLPMDGNNYGGYQE